MDNNNMNQPQDNPYQQPAYQQPNQYQQPAYQQPQVNVYQQAAVSNEEVTIGNWIGTLLLLTFVPCVNIIMLFVWAFSSSTPKSKSNFCKAYLIVVGIMVVLMIILYAIMGAALISAFN